MKIMWNMNSTVTQITTWRRDSINQVGSVMFLSFHCHVMDASLLALVTPLPGINTAVRNKATVGKINTKYFNIPPNF